MLIRQPCWYGSYQLQTFTGNFFLFLSSWVDGESNCQKRLFYIVNIDDNNDTTLSGGYDIGNCVGCFHDINNFTKFMILKHHWVPPTHHVFPFSVRNKHNREEKWRLNHYNFSNYSWLVYSDVKKEFFCKHCAIFSYDILVGGQKTITVYKLVKEPLIRFTKLEGKNEDWVCHSQTRYHKLAIVKVNHLFKYIKNHHIIFSLSGWDFS